VRGPAIGCVIAGACLLLVGCQSLSPRTGGGAGGVAGGGVQASSSAPVVRLGDPLIGNPLPSAARPTPAASSPSPRPSSAVATSGRRLPRGGRTILGHSRVVAFYGAPGTAALGALGRGSPEQAARSISARAAGFAGYGRRVQPAMELIATVAQRSPGHDGTYSKPVGAAKIDSYLAAAHAHKMLLILDLQPGRGSFLAQAKALRPFLLDPSVSLALDPEWHVGPHASPGNGLIGSSSAAGINAVGSWLSRLVRAHHLPDKLLVVHEFTARMLPDRANITQHPGLELVLHADGFGPPALKIKVLHQLAFPGPPFGVGFKLFFTQDSRLMTPREVMALDPRPDVITFQ
jgi:hypothetical protein